LLRVSYVLLQLNPADTGQMHDSPGLHAMMIWHICMPGHVPAATHQRQTAIQVDACMKLAWSVRTYSSA